MKKKSFLFILSLCLILPSLFFLSACTKNPPAEPIKLNAPVATLNNDVVSWTAVSNASSYEISVNNSTNTIAITITQYTLTDGQTFKVRAVGDGTNYSTSDWSNSVTYNAPNPPPTEPTELSAPVVSINESGLASWNAVANASGYTYKINNGTEQSTNSTSIQLTDGDSIVVKAVGDGVDYSDSNYSQSVTYTAPAEPVELTIPVVSINESGIASWNAVANASGYTYKINNGTEQSTTSTSVQLSDGDSIVVKAVGNGTEYTDSAYSESKTYTAPIPPVEPTELNVPVVSINESGLASWNAVTNASGYKYKINNGTEQSTTSTSVQLTDGDSIVVKAVGDGEEYLDSAYSSAVTYNANLTQLSAPTITIDTSGRAIWNLVYHATGYVYKINNGAEQTTGILTEDRVVQLSDGDSIVVKALGDGTTYSDSNYSESVTYTAPITPTTVTYSEIKDVLEENLNIHIQASYSRGTVTNSNVVDISSDGTVYCTYQRGTVTYMATIQITGLENATTLNEAYTIVNLTTNYGTVEGKEFIQPTEDAIALVEKTMQYSTSSTYYTYEQLNGYTKDDIVWVTATTFSSACATNITVVLNDGKMVKYTLSCGGAVSSASAKNDYINGCAHNIGNITTSEYQSLEDKFAVATYADVVSAVETNATAKLQEAHGRFTKVSNLTIFDITSDGIVYCSYITGTSLRQASIQISGMENATNYKEALTIVQNIENYNAPEGKETIQPTEDALALVEAGIRRGGIDALDGYTKDDIVWATATTFDGKAADITVVFDDGKMVKYTLRVDGAASSTTAGTEYIGGAAFYILNETTSEYQSLEDKLS